MPQLSMITLCSTLLPLPARCSVHVRNRSSPVLVCLSMPETLMPPVRVRWITYLHIGLLRHEGDFKIDKRLLLHVHTAVKSYIVAVYLRRSSILCGIPLSEYRPATLAERVLSPRPSCVT